MKLLSLLLFIITFSFSSASYSSDNSLLLKEMKNMKSVEKTNIDKTFKLLIRAGKTLELGLDRKVISETARLLVLTFKVDSNYYTVEPFTGVIEKNEKGFLSALKKLLPKKDYKTLKENIQMMKREASEGNG